jgi:hypothetical protein
LAGVAFPLLTSHAGLIVGLGGGFQQPAASSEGCGRLRGGRVARSRRFWAAKGAIVAGMAAGRIGAGIRSSTEPWQVTLVGTNLVL